MGGDFMGSDSCNRPDRKKIKIGTDGETIDTTAVKDGEDLLVPVKTLEKLIKGTIRLEEGTGNIYIDEHKDQAIRLPEDIKKRVWDAIDKKEESIREACNFIYDHPELGDEEIKASALLTERLKEYGFTVTKGLKGKCPETGEERDLMTAFEAVYDSGLQGPTLAVMLEYDALPMGHGCGHNLIAASGLAAAVGIASLMDQLTGRLVVFGTPAEEGGKLGGKVPMIEAGYFDEVDIAMITHGGDRWDTGSPWLAVKSTTVTFKGTPAHAAAAPHLGRSALDALVLAYQGIEMLREHTRDDTRIHGIVKNGGAASNIVPEEAQAQYSVRSLDNGYLEELQERMDDIAKGAALACGCEVDIKWSYGYRAPINVPFLDDLVLDQARTLDIEPVKPWTALASSDLGNVGERLPTVNLWFAAAPWGAELHTKEFLEASRTHSALQAALKAGKALALSGVSLLHEPKRVEKVKEEFAKIRGK